MISHELRQLPLAYLSPAIYSISFFENKNTADRTQYLYTCIDITAIYTDITESGNGADHRSGYRKLYRMLKCGPTTTRILCGTNSNTNGEVPTASPSISILVSGQVLISIFLACV